MSLEGARKVMASWGPSSCVPADDYLFVGDMQEALKFMRHSRRGELSTEHLNDALRLHNSQVPMHPCLSSLFAYVPRGLASRSLHS